MNFTVPSYDIQYPISFKLPRGLAFLFWSQFELVLCLSGFCCHLYFFLSINFIIIIIMSGKNIKYHYCVVCMVFLKVLE